MGVTGGFRLPRARVCLAYNEPLKAWISPRRQVHAAGSPCCDPEATTPSLATVAADHKDRHTRSHVDRAQYSPPPQPKLYTAKPVPWGQSGCTRRAPHRREPLWKDPCADPGERGFPYPHGRGGGGVGYSAEWDVPWHEQTGSSRPKTGCRPSNRHVRMKGQPSGVVRPHPLLERPSGQRPQRPSELRVCVSSPPSTPDLVLAASNCPIYPQACLAPSVVKKGTHWGHRFPAPRSRIARRWSSSCVALARWTFMQTLSQRSQEARWVK